MKKNKKHLNIDKVKVFIVVAEELSITKASEKLNLGKSRVSKILIELEKEVGTKLLYRSTRSISLTELGQVFLSRSNELLRLNHSILSELANHKDKPTGTLRIAIPFGTVKLYKVLGQFSDLHPQLNLELIESEDIIDLNKEGIDIAIRSSETSDVNNIRIHLGNFRANLYASRGYLKNKKIPKSIDDLDNLDWISHTRIFKKNYISFKNDMNEEYKKYLKPKIKVETVITLKELILSGHGFGVLPSLIFKGNEANESLKALLKDKLQLSTPLYAVYPSREFLPSKTRAFIDYLKGNKEKLGLV